MLPSRCVQLLIWLNQYTFVKLFPVFFSPLYMLIIVFSHYTPKYYVVRDYQVGGIFYILQEVDKSASNQALPLKKVRKVLMCILYRNKGNDVYQHCFPSGLSRIAKNPSSLTLVRLYRHAMSQNFEAVFFTISIGSNIHAIIFNLTSHAHARARIQTHGEKFKQLYT